MVFDSDISVEVVGNKQFWNFCVQYTVHSLKNVKRQAGSLAYTISKEAKEILSELSEKHCCIQKIFSCDSVTWITMPVNLGKCKKKKMLF